MKHVTTIKGPPKAYKTAMLVLVANNEASKGHTVTYSTGDESEISLRRRGLDPVVAVRILTDSNDKNRLGKVVSVETAYPKDTFVWRIRQVRRKGGK